jgi:RNA polymerase sigma factor (sigma-70 family)
VAVIAALAALPEQQRRAVVLHYIADLSVPEVAEREGVPEGTVSQVVATPCPGSGLPPSWRPLTIR